MKTINNAAMEHMLIQRAKWEAAQIVAHEWVPLKECVEYGRPIFEFDGKLLIWRQGGDWELLQYIDDMREMHGAPRRYPKANNPIEAICAIYAWAAAELDRLELISAITHQPSPITHP